MHIAFCTDINYLMPTGVAMISICENNRDIDICFHIVVTINQGVTLESFYELREIALKYDKKVFFYQISEGVLPKENHEKIAHVTKTTYSRFYLSDLLPQSVDKVLYLDCDIICQDSLLKCWNICLSEHNSIIGGVEDFGCYSGSMREPLSLSIKDTYINAGVLLIDLKGWRTGGFAKKCINYAYNNHFPFMDQDVINTIFRGQIYILPFTYNLQVDFYIYDEYFWMISAERMKEVRDAKIKPAILHYSTLKPWKNPESLYSRIWFDYFQKSPWSNRNFYKIQIHKIIYSPFLSKLKNLYWSEFSLMYRTLPLYLSIIQIVHKFRIFFSKMKGKS